MPQDPDVRLDTYLHTVARRLRHLPHTQRTQELGELRAHLDTLVRDRLLRGHPHDDAVTDALRSFGHPDQLGRALARSLPNPRRWVRAALVGLTVTLGVSYAVAQSVPAPWDAVDASLEVAREFMAYGQAQDANAASALFSLPERWGAGSPGQLAKLFADRADVFGSFVSLEQEKYNSTVRWGTFARIDGKVTLTSGDHVEYSASFVNALGTWKLRSFELR